jgi:hypothetical protein
MASSSMSITYCDVLYNGNIKPLQGLYDVPMVTLSCAQAIHFEAFQASLCQKFIFDCA